MIVTKKDIEEYHKYEKEKKECGRCKKFKPLTELVVSRNETGGKPVATNILICGDCVKLSDKISHWTKNDKQCIICGKYKSSWMFIEESDREYVASDKCFSCRVYEKSITKMLQEEKVKCEYCKKDYTYLEIFRTDHQFKCISCIKDSINEKTKLEIKSPIHQSENGKECSICKSKYPIWYLDNSICNKCKYIKIFSEMKKKKKGDDSSNSLEITNEDAIVYRSRSPHHRDDDIYSHPKFLSSGSLSDSYESSSFKKSEEKDSILQQFRKFNNCSLKYTIPSELDHFLKYNCCKTNCSLCNEDVSILKVYIYNNKCFCLICAANLKSKEDITFFSWIRECKTGKECSNCKISYPCFCYIDDHYIETNKCLVCRNEEDLLIALNDNIEENDTYKQQLRNEYIGNGIEVKCSMCNNKIKKTSAYGSFIKPENKYTVQYVRDNKYYCLDCSIKKQKENEAKGEKSMKPKRVFDDEYRGLRQCGKCNKVYPKWHYITEKGKLSMTNNCLECRNKEKLTKNKSKAE